MEQNQIYLIKSGQNSFIETEGEATIGLSGGNIGFGTTQPEAFIHVTGNTQIDGDLTVKGDFTTVNSSTIQVDDKNIEIGVGATTDASADGGGITLHGATEKTINWANSTDAWTSSEHFNVADGKRVGTDEVRALDNAGLKLSDDAGNGIFVEDGGQVGIGSTAPTASLDVVGGGKFSTTIEATTSVTSASVSGTTSVNTPLIKASTSAGLSLQDDGGNGIFIEDGGQVGIGSTAPTVALDVVGAAKISTDLTVEGDLTVNGVTTTINSTTLAVDDKNVELGSVDTPTDTTANGGGITLKGSTDKTLNWVNSSSAWTSSEHFNVADGKRVGTDEVRALDNAGLKLSDDAGNGIFVEDGGQVGIGSTSPSAQLDVVGVGKFQVGNGGSTFCSYATGASTSANQPVLALVTNEANDQDRVRFNSDGDSWFNGGSLGIGTKSPDNTLQVSGGYIGVDNGYGLTTSGGLKYIADSDDDAPATGAIHNFFTDVSTSALVILKSGNVGIGTTNPNRKLQIHSDTAVSQILAVTTLSGATAISHASIGHGSNKIGNLQLGNASGNLKVFLTSEGASYINGGSLGIGTPNPAGNLHIFDNSVSNGESLGLVLSNYDYGVGETDQSVSIQARVRNSGGGDSAVAKIRFGKDSDFSSVDNRDGNIQFHTMFGSGGTASFNECMRIDSSGNVGIGTTSPSTALEVNGEWGSQLRISRDSSPSTQYSEISGGGSTMKFLSVSSTPANSSHSSFTFASDDGTDEFERMRIDANGNVGIGTTIPATALEINKGTGESSPIITLSRGGVAKSRFAVANATSSVLTGSLTDDLCFRTEGGNIRFGTSGATKTDVTILSSGNVGIGTTNPSANIHVVGDNAVSGSQGFIRISNNVNGEAGLIGDSIALMSGGVASQLAIRSGTAGIVLGVGSSPKMTIDSVGRVGIGTTNPGFAFEVQSSDATWASRIYNTASSADAAGLLVRTNATAAHNALVFGVFADGAYKVTMKSNGRVGIGISNPSTELDVLGSIEYTGTITDVSDQRKKENVEDLENSLSKICQLNGKSYEMIDDDQGEEGTELGFIAQQVQQIFPEIVKVVERQESEDGEIQEYLGVSYIQLIAPLVESIKEQQSIIEDLKARIETLES